jgi:hypothetical protein
MKSFQQQSNVPLTLPQKKGPMEMKLLASVLQSETNQTLEFLP